MILRVALPVPLRRYFDYLPGPETPRSGWQPGIRVQVPFAGKQRTGLVMEIADHSSLPTSKLKAVSAVLDQEPLLGREELELIRWTGRYYHHPPGEVAFQALPSRLRQGKPARKTGLSLWRLTDAGKAAGTEDLGRAPRQRQLVELLQAWPGGLTADLLSTHCPNWHAPMKSLRQKGRVEQHRVEPGARAHDSATHSITLNDAQQAAVDSIAATLETGGRFLLDGITGSGKTEIYVELIRRVLERGGQALVLVPEIGLTHQLIARLRQCLPAHIVLLHSGLGEGERLQGWLEARDGTAGVVLGTRSAVWTCLQRAGIIIVDEEHDPSYKQQETLRYSARDLAIKRATDLNVPVVLGSATPSMESLHNALDGRYQRLTLSERAGEARLPQTGLVDLRNRTMHGALSDVMVEAIRRELANQRQVLLFLNRRGFSPVIMCHHCGWVATCPRCDIPMTYHKQRRGLLCHHCGSQAAVSDECRECRMADLIQVGYGTERLTETLAEVFPDARVLRIDRDSTRARGAMEDIVSAIHAGAADILVGTQMLAKGHHFPDLTLVGIIDADSGLFSADFRASERMAQLLMQVSGRAGRADSPGKVLIQTHYPQHPLLTTLLQEDYHAFARALLEERHQAWLPPFSHLALLSAEDYDEQAPAGFLNQARGLLQRLDDSLEIMGPAPAPMEKRAGRFRFQLLVQSDRRPALHAALAAWGPALEDLPAGKKVRWALDVDPQDML